MPQISPKEDLLKLNKNYNILKEREAKYAGSAPLDLLNQIEDHEQAIELTRQVIAGDLSQAEWQEALKPLLLAVSDGQVVNIEAETYIAGDVEGDVIAGDKIITNIYEAPPPALPPAEARERRDLSILLNKVKIFWIEGVLEKSVHNMALIDLGKETQVEAVAHAWEQVLDLPDHSRQTLSPDKKISHIFNEMNRGLLILGEPGSGKTVTLLQLAQDLIAQVEADETFSQPVPVIFNLSSWIDKGQPLIDWMVTELTAKYQIPKRIGKLWLENNRLLPLLDGLDEVKVENQAACVEAINQFEEEFGLASLVVCSRIQEYTSLPVRLKLNGAIRLQPLTLEQIYDYLSEAGSKLDTLQQALQKDDSLQELAKSPLTLGIMILAYQDITVEFLNDQSLDTVDAHRKHLFDTYIERMFNRKGKRDRPYTDNQTKLWLNWLANHMADHNQAIFLIEQLQPSWLSNDKHQLLYMLSSRTIGGLFIGLGIGTILFPPEYTGTDFLWIWLFFWLFIGIFGGALVGIVDRVRFEYHEKILHIFKNIPAYWLAISNFFVIGFLNILLAVIGFALTAQIFNISLAQIFGPISTLSFGIITGLSLGVRNNRQNLANDIQTTEALSWSWGAAFKGAILGAIYGLSSGVIFGLVFGLISGIIRGVIGGQLTQLIFKEIFGVINNIIGDSLIVLSFILTFGLIFGPIGGLIGVMFGGLKSIIMRTKTTPNQGIKLSIRNAVFAGVSIWVIFSLSGVLGFGLLFGVTDIVVNIVRDGLLFGLLGTFWFGGIDVIQHYTLRLILWYKNYTPRTYIRFLDYATERIFLQKVGGGYIFIHRLLLEHFAEMESHKP